MSIKLGLDFYDTITTNPKLFKRLASAVLASGGSVYIISAVQAGNEKKARRAIQRSHVPHTSLYVLPYASWHEVPTLKSKLAATLGIDIFIDDRADTLAALPCIGLKVV